jgi:exodeoxyribonuclease V alpha subunit
MRPALTPTVPASLQSLTPWVQAGVFATAEIHAAAVLVRGDPSANHEVALGAALALWAPLHGHVCIDLESVAEMVRAELAISDDDLGEAAAAMSPDDPDAPGSPTLALFNSLLWPQPADWLRALQSSSIVRVVHQTDAQPVLDQHALVLSGQRLYTQRQWVDECVVATALRSRATAQIHTSLSESATQLLQRLLPAIEHGEPNLQHQAAQVALAAPLGVIVGGPGTGKTHTVARTLAVLLAQAEADGKMLRIALAAPTGKAAARLRDAIVTAAAAAQPDTGETIIPARLAEQLQSLPTTTLHRLLGPRGMASTRFTHNADHPLPHDVIVIDETSMVALPLMARLLEATRPDARLILVGDPDQLESVDVGAILADIVEASHDLESPLHARVVRLSRARRQQFGSPISPLADAIRENRPDDVMIMLRRGAADPITHAPVLTFVDHADALRSAATDDLRELIVAPCRVARDAALRADGAAALRELAGIRVLCAHRRGPHGADHWNRSIEAWLLGSTPRATFYPGRALLVTRNDPGTHLSNGDTGVVVAHPDGVRAAFNLGTDTAVREFAPAQLEDVETAFAMTIHKSQGSEYATVVVVLPPATSPLIGRELLYTAITRTTHRLVVVGTEAAVIRAVQTPARRVTGLAVALCATRD